MVDDLGPLRRPESHPSVYRSNLLFGYSLRFVLLSEAGLSSKVLDEVRDCFYPMALKTGTLWESVSPEKGYSCCHGFPSMAAWLLARDALGVRRINRATKELEVAVPQGIDLAWCEGRLPVSETEEVRVRWHRRNGRNDLAVDLPRGWRRASESTDLTMKGEPSCTH